VRVPVTPLTVYRVAEIDVAAKKSGVSVCYEFPELVTPGATVDESNAHRAWADASARQSAMEFLFGRIMDRSEGDVWRKIRYYSYFKHFQDLDCCTPRGYAQTPARHSFRCLFFDDPISSSLGCFWFIGRWLVVPWVYRIARCRL